MKAARRPRSAPTISDVARLAGVSPMTVSRVINGEGNVRPATRAVVNTAIADLNYSPNIAARTLAGAGQCRIGLLYSNPSPGFLSEFLVGGLDQARRLDVQLVLEKCELGEHEIEVAKHMMDGGVDGMILVSPLCDSPELIRTLVEEGMPIVLVGSGQSVPELYDISIDDHAAAYAMTKHILSLGHRRIGFIMGSPAQVASTRRHQGFCDALADCKIALDPGLVVGGLFTYRSGLDAAEQLLDLPEPPTAIFASNDDMAAATVAVAHKRGLDVPGDLTVCGFDDTTLATTIWPELTTIRQPIADMSRAAIELLASALRKRGGDVEEPHRLLDFTLIRRQSDAVPRRRPVHRLS